MKPPPESRVAYYLLYFYMHDLASADDVVSAASQLDKQELTYFKLVCQVSYPPDVCEERILPMLGRLQ